MKNILIALTALGALYYFTKPSNPVAYDPINEPPKGVETLENLPFTEFLEEPLEQTEP